MEGESKRVMAGCRREEEKDRGRRGTPVNEGAWLIIKRGED